MRILVLVLLSTYWNGFFVSILKSIEFKSDLENTTWSMHQMADRLAEIVSAQNHTIEMNI